MYHPTKRVDARPMRRVIRNVMAQHVLSAPVSLDTLARDHQIRIVVTPDLPRRVEGFSLVRSDGPRIVINSRLSRFAQRFTLAHELVHLWHHREHGVPNGSPTAIQAHPYYDLLELEANVGAAEILLPYDWFVEQAQKLIGSPLTSHTDLQQFLTTSEARRWAGQARVTLSVLKYHLMDVWFAPALDPRDPQDSADLV